MGSVSVYPTGTTRYDPEKAFNGYTLLTKAGGKTFLMDMNGRRREWSSSEVSSQSFFREGMTVLRDPISKMLRPVFMETSGRGEDCYLIERVVSESRPSGYPASLEWMGAAEEVYLLLHPWVSLRRKKGEGCEDLIVKTGSDGTIREEISSGRLLLELKRFQALSDDTKEEGKNRSEYEKEGISSDLSIDSIALLGENPHAFAGHTEFDPGNLLITLSEQNQIIFYGMREKRVLRVIDCSQLGNNPVKSEGMFLPHSAHLIPKGLPGEGNLLCLDSGAPIWKTEREHSPYPAPGRFYSKILELDPITMEVIWSLNPSHLGESRPFVSDHFYWNGPVFLQRLPNGNTFLVSEEEGIIKEVTDDHELVYEYLVPECHSKVLTRRIGIKAVRIPYELGAVGDLPYEEAVVPPVNADFRLPGAEGKEMTRVVMVEGTEAFEQVGGFCLKRED